jgi:hypothetical protein
LKRQTAEVSSKTTLIEEFLPRQDAVRKDSAACVSLSSYSLVKQPEITRISHPSVTRRAVEARHPRTVGCRFTVPVRSFKGASSRRNAVQRADGPYIGWGPFRSQLQKSESFEIVMAASCMCEKARTNRILARVRGCGGRTEAIFLGRPLPPIRGMDLRTGGAPRRYSQSRLTKGPASAIDGSWANRHRAGLESAACRGRVGLCFVASASHLRSQRKGR